MFLHFIDLFLPENVHFMKKEKMGGEGALRLNWTSGKNMDRYLQRTICRSCSGGNRDGLVSAFCGPGREWLLKSDQMVQTQWLQAVQSPQNNRSLHSQHPGSSLGSPSTLLSWVSHVLVKWGKPHGQQDKYGVVEKSTGWKGLRPSKGYLFSM